MKREHLPTIVVALVALVAGYFAGREHLKYELRSAVEGALGGIAKGLHSPSEPARDDAVVPADTPKQSEEDVERKKAADKRLAELEARQRAVEARRAQEATEQAKRDEEQRQLREQQADYARNHVELYDVTAQYRNDMLSGRVPCVGGKLKNSGDRTLKRVKIIAYFQDASGRTIFEEDYFPVLVSQMSIGKNKPLKAGYIETFLYKAEGVPSEWVEGKATVTVAEVEFE
jgi:hypothetical protein